MSNGQLSSEQVPQKFLKWLLAIGCPPVDVPPLDKISEMCKREYNEIWQSTMEIKPKDSIRNKRLQVFIDDVNKCQKIDELDENMPKQLNLWEQHSELKPRVADAEARLQEKRHDLNQLMSQLSVSDNARPKFTDELRFYLEKFNLEKNRKLVLESGKKIWIFESVQSCMDQLYAKWCEDDVTTSFVCPSVSVAHNLDRLAQTVMEKTELEAIKRSMVVAAGKRYKLSIDISSTTEEELKTLEKVKKQLNDNMLTLKNTANILDDAFDHLNME